MRRSLAILAAALALAASPRASGAAPDLRPVRADTARVDLGTTTAFVAWPAGEGPAPAVLVVHEWWGLNLQIREVARRLAREGYVAIVPDLYHGRVTDDPERAHEILRGVGEEAAIGELQAALRWLRAGPRTGKTRIGVVGFCFGGGLALRLGLESRALSAVVMFYGTPIVDPERLASLGAPLQGHFGADDQGIPGQTVEAFRAALGSARRNAEVFVYPGAGHAFMHEGRASHNADAARRAWARTLAFLQRHLKG